MSNKPPFDRQFLAPRFWPTWLYLGLLWLIVKLPQRGRMATGSVIGRLFLAFAGKRRRIAEINLKNCFPELDTPQQRKLLKAHFESLGMALIETAMAWWLPPDKLQQLGQIEGLEHIQRCQAQGQGVLLLSAHFLSLELGNRLLSYHFSEPLSIMYQRHKHPIMEWIIQHNRGQHAEMIGENDIRQLIRALKAKKLVWYAADQGYSNKNHALVPFFGIPACSNTALSRIAQVNEVRVIPFFTERLADRSGYRLRILPPLEDFPSGEVIADVQRYHQLIEQQARRTPEQYLWVHRRFKNRPQPHEDLYHGL